MEKIKVWIKLEEHFIDESNIRSIQNKGNITVVERIIGEPIEVKVSYNKIKQVLNPNLI